MKNFKIKKDSQIVALMFNRSLAVSRRAVHLGPEPDPFLHDELRCKKR